MEDKENLKQKYKGIEKYINPDKLDTTLVPDVEDEHIGLVLKVNNEGDVEWGHPFRTEIDIDDLLITLGIYGDKIVALIQKIEKLEIDGMEMYKEIIAMLKIEKDNILAIVGQLEKVVSSNHDFVKDYIKSNNQTIAEISQMISMHSSALDILNKQIELVVSSTKIIGAYVPGNNKIPTRTWHNQVNPVNNGHLVGFLFQQDSGWIGASDKNFRLMFGGKQRVELDNPFGSVNGEYTHFSIDVWFTPYTTMRCDLMDGIQLYDENTNLRIKAPNIDIRTNTVISTGVNHHLCITVNMQSKQFLVMLDNEEVELFKTINTSIWQLPDIISFFNEFEGDVHSIKIYKKSIDKTMIERNFKEGPLGQNYLFFNLIVCMEAIKAETILNNSEFTEASINILKDEINMKVSNTQYEQDKEIINDKITQHTEKITSMISGIKILADRIEQKVSVSVWESEKKTLEDNIEQNRLNISLNTSGIQNLKDSLRLYVTTVEFESNKEIVQGELKSLSEKYESTSQEITLLKGQIELKVDVTTYNTAIADITDTQAQHTEAITNNTAGINILKDEIKQKVTATDVENIVSSNHSGTINLIRNSSFASGKLHWTCTSNFDVNSTAGILTVPNGGTVAAFLSSEMENRTDLKFVFSGMLSLSKNGNVSEDKVTMQVTQIKKGTSQREVAFSQEISINKINLHKVEPIKVILRRDTTAMLRLEFVVPNENRLEISRPKLEAGLKPSDWSPGNDEYYEKLDTKYEKVTSEIKINLDGVTTSVSRVEGNATLVSNSKMKIRYIRDHVNGCSVDSSNRWTEIQALNEDGDNLATGKTVTGNSSISNSSVIVDGKHDLSDSSAYADISTIDEETKTAWVQIDLGSVTNDIAYIKIWHYHLDARTYHKTRTEISEDGETWKPIYDSKYSGEYVETIDGLIIPISAGSSVSKLTERVATAEHKITPDAITSTVTSSTKYKADISEIFDKINGLQSGNVNLLRNSGNFKDLSFWDKEGAGSVLNLREKDTFKVIEGAVCVFNTTEVPLKAGSEYMYAAEVMFSKDLDATELEPLHFWMHDGSDVRGAMEKVELKSPKLIKANTWNRISLQLTTKANIPSGSYFKGFIKSSKLDALSFFWIKNIMFMEGNQLGSWTPNVEDFTAELEAAKEALQKEITDVSNSLTNLDNTINTTFKDGVISEAEAISLKESLRQLEVEKLDITAKYEQLYSHADLPYEAKMSLYDSYAIYESAHRRLRDAIDLAISDRKITPEEQSEVDQALSEYSTALNGISTGLQEALNAIANKVSNDMLDEANNQITVLHNKISKIEQTSSSITSTVEDLKVSIKNLDIGSNLLLNSSNFKTLEHWEADTTMYGDVSLSNGELLIDGSVLNTTRIKISPSQPLIISAEINPSSSIEVGENNVLTYRIVSQRDEDNNNLLNDNNIIDVDIIEEDKVEEEIGCTRVGRNYTLAIIGIKISNVSTEGHYTLTYTVIDAAVDGTIEHYLSIDRKEFTSIYPNGVDNVYTYMDAGLETGDHTATIKIVETVNGRTTTAFSEAFIIAVPGSDVSDEYFEYIQVIGAKSAPANTYTKIAVKLKAKSTLPNNLIINVNVQVPGPTKLKNIQAEKSSIATGHAPSPEEMQEEIDKAKENLQTEIKDVTNSLNGLNDTMNGAFKDGVLNEAEKTAIKERVQQLNKEKADVDRQYMAIYNNNDLTAPHDARLRTAKIDFDNAHSNLLEVIRRILEKTTITDYDRNMLEGATSQYSSKMSYYSEAQAKAVDAIASKKQHDAMDHTDGQITIVTKKISQVEQTADSITSTVGRLEIKTNGLENSVDAQWTQIHQNSNSISLKIGTANEVVTVLNADHTGITIKASKLDLTGTVTFYDLSNDQESTRINGNNIRTGMISAIDVTANKFISTGVSEFYKGSSFANHVDFNNSIAVKNSLHIPTDGNLYIYDRIEMWQNNIDGLSGNLWFNWRHGSAVKIGSGNNNYTLGPLYCSGVYKTAGYTIPKQIDNQQPVMFTSYSMGEHYVGDIGSGYTDKDGICYVSIDETMQNNINPALTYHVFLQECGEGRLWIDQRQPQYFIVKGTPNLQFSWELKAKRKLYEQYRYEPTYITELESNYDPTNIDHTVKDEYRDQIEQLLEHQEDITRYTFLDELHHEQVERTLLERWLLK